MLANREIFGVVSVLLRRNIPHNMVMLRGRSFSPSQSSSKVVRTVLIPRKPHHGACTHTHTHTVVTVWVSVWTGAKGLSCELPPLSAAACELAQGFVPVLGTAPLGSHHSIIATCNVALQMTPSTPLSLSKRSWTFSDRPCCQGKNSTMYLKRSNYCTILTQHKQTQHKHSTFIGLVLL